MPPAGPRAYASPAFATSCTRRGSVDWSGRGTKPAAWAAAGVPMSALLERLVLWRLARDCSFPAGRAAIWASGASFPSTRSPSIYMPTTLRPNRPRHRCTPTPVPGCWPQSLHGQARIGPNRPSASPHRLARSLNPDDAEDLAARASRNVQMDMHKSSRAPGHLTRLIHPSFPVWANAQLPLPGGPPVHTYPPRRTAVSACRFP